jgi:isoquinoline 1-oxidoreductase beta subunit
MKSRWIPNDDYACTQSWLWSIVVRWSTSGSVAQQTQSSVIYGLSAALYGEIAIRGGEVEAGNFDGYPMLRMAKTPLIEVPILPSGEAPGGVGERGLPPKAPALANAVARLTGIRPRRLPLLDASGIVRDLSAGA